MIFDARDIRPGMDVFTTGGVYLGTVRRLVFDRVAQWRAARLGRCWTNSVVGGEMHGPVSTGELGNYGPRNQGAAAGYAVNPSGVVAGPIAWFTVRPGRWWAKENRYSVDAVCTVSMERVVLAESASL